MSFKYHRQRYIDCTYETAKAAGWDTVQLKYDGEYKLYDEQGTGLLCVLLGDVFTGPRWVGTELDNKFIVWDCLVSNGQNLHTFSYRNRFAYVKIECQRLGVLFKSITPYPIGAAPDLWRLKPVGTKGVVYRNSKAVYGEDLCVARRYDEMPGELP